MFTERAEHTSSQRMVRVEAPWSQLLAVAAKGLTRHRQALEPSVNCSARGAAGFVTDPGAMAVKEFALEPRPPGSGHGD